jgi:beta-glucosidase
MNPTRLENALAEITALTSAPVTFAAGYLTGAGEDGAGEDTETADALLAEAVEAAHSSDVAVVFLGTAGDSEGIDAVTLDLPAAQLELVGQVAVANPKTVVVLANGGVVLTTPWSQHVPALIEGWLGGQAGGGAIADVLFGLVNPSGRLAETIPLRLADHPSYLDFPGEAGHVRYGENLFVGYRGFDAREQEVAYPFGFGLSYTTFSYGPAEASVAADGAIEVRVPVSNVGSRDGREVVQAYATLPGSRVRRAPSELRGFASVPIAAGATADVLIRIPRADLAYWDQGLGRWVVEGGDYLLAVGASSRDARSTVKVAVEGDDARTPLTADSTLGQWLSDPRAGHLIGQAVARAAENGSQLASLAADPQLLSFISAMPLSRLAGFPGSPLTAELIEELAAAVRAPADA